MMLEVQTNAVPAPVTTAVPELPKNVNGYRTTHTCELCGFEPKTKNKYREKQDHLVMKHFKDRIDKIFPTCRPYSCPQGSCTFTGKDKQALLRHYTGKHGILEKYLREALAEKGIHYKPGELGKRKHSTSSEGKAKNPRLSLNPPTQNGKAANNDHNGVAVVGKPITLPTRPNTEELRKEVEAMMASLKPVEQPAVVLPLSPSDAVVPGSMGQMIGSANGIATIIGQTPPSSVVTTPSPPPVNGGSPPPNTVVVVNQQGQGQQVPMGNSVTIPGNVKPLPIKSNAANGGTAALPPIVLSAVANVTAANAAANAVKLNNGHMNGGTVVPVSSINATQQLSNGMMVSADGLDLVPVSGGNITLPTNPTPVKVIDMSNNPNLKLNAPAPISAIINAAQEQQRQKEQQQQQQTVILAQQQGAIQFVNNEGVIIGNGMMPSGNSMPVPIELIQTQNGELKHGEIIAVDASGVPMNVMNVNQVVENEDVMWSAPANGGAGPAVVVEATNTVPVTYIENVDAASFAAATLENIEYDYMYPATTTAAVAPSDVRERQLDFNML